MSHLLHDASKDSFVNEVFLQCQCTTTWVKHGSLHFTNYITYVLLTYHLLLKIGSLHARVDHHWSSSTPLLQYNLEHILYDHALYYTRCTELQNHILLGIGQPHSLIHAKVHCFVHHLYYFFPQNEATFPLVRKDYYM